MPGQYDPEVIAKELAWRAENSEAIDCFNTAVEEFGLPLACYQAGQWHDSTSE